VAGFFEIAASHERCSDPLPQGNDSRHRQELFTGQGEEDAPRAALPHLVKAPRRLLERLECRAERLSRAPWTIGAIITVERHAQPQRAPHDATTQPAVKGSGSGSGSDPQWPINPIHVGRISLRQRQRDRIRGPHNDNGSTKKHSTINVCQCIGPVFSAQPQEGSEMSQLDRPFVVMPGPAL
jgi:hypothetical protein